MRNYEVTFIVDPVLSGDEIKATAQTYVDALKKEGCTIVHVDEMGLKQLAYIINKRTTGVYFCVEFQTETGNMIPSLELAFRRDERIMRFLTFRLDKYAVKYNDDKRNGKIGTVKKKPKKAEGGKRNERGGRNNKKETPRRDAPKKEAPAPEKKVAPVVAAAPVVEAPPAPKVAAVKEEE